MALTVGNNNDGYYLPPKKTKEAPKVEVEQPQKAPAQCETSGAGSSTIGQDYIVGLKRAELGLDGKVGKCDVELKANVTVEEFDFDLYHAWLETAEPGDQFVTNNGVYTMNKDLKIEFEAYTPFPEPSKEDLNQMPAKGGSKESGINITGSEIGIGNNTDSALNGNFSIDNVELKTNATVSGEYNETLFDAWTKKAKPGEYIEFFGSNMKIIKNEDGSYTFEKISS